MGTWERLRLLEGSVLPTAGGKSTFTIIEVQDDVLILAPAGGKRTKRRIYKRQITAAEQMGLLRSDVVPGDVKATRVTVKHLSYLTTLLRLVAPPLQEGGTRGCAGIAAGSWVAGKAARM